MIISINNNTVMRVSVTEITLEASATATGNDGEAARQVGFLPFTHRGQARKGLPFFIMKER